MLSTNGCKRKHEWWITHTAAQTQHARWYASDCPHATTDWGLECPCVSATEMCMRNTPSAMWNVQFLIHNNDTRRVVEQRKSWGVSVCKYVCASRWHNRNRYIGFLYLLQHMLHCWIHHSNNMLSIFSGFWAQWKQTCGIFTSGERNAFNVKTTLMHERAVRKHRIIWHFTKGEKPKSYSHSDTKTGKLPKSITV